MKPSSWTLVTACRRFRGPPGPPPSPTHLPASAPARAHDPRPSRPGPEPSPSPDGLPQARGRRCGGAGRAAGAGTPGGGGAARSAGSGAAGTGGRHGVALHQPPLLPGAALEPAGPLRRGSAADPAQLLGPRERGAGPRRRRFPQGPVPCRRPGPRPGRAAHSVPAGLRRVDGARGAQRCFAGARVRCGRPQEQAPRGPWPGCLRAPHRRRGLGCGNHVLQVWGFGQGSASSRDPVVGGNGGREP